jgi:excisionase family DNA binding protein
VFLVFSRDTGAVADVFADPEALLTTGEVAQLLGSSRQHVVDLCERGTLACESVGTHRRIRAVDAYALQRSGDQGGLTADALRSLWLHTAVAGKVVADPQRVVRRAARNLDGLVGTHPRGNAARQLQRWGRLLRGPLDELVDALTSRSARSVELRQNSPFAGVLTDRERRRVLEAFRASRRP